MEGITFDTRVEDLRHVWIPLSLKMSISKSQGLEISSWPEGEEVGPRPLHGFRPSVSELLTCVSAAERGRGGRGRLPLRPGGHRAPHPGPSHRREPGHAHQSGGDVPSKERGEVASEGGRERDAVNTSALFPQGVTHQQWYLFNDFLIEPIDKVSVLFPPLQSQRGALSVM